MAFQILSREEIDLLNDQQKAQYERELALYRQREAFVEQIEKLEQVHIERYQPKLIPIEVIEDVELRSYRKPDYIPAICEPVKKPYIKIVSFKKSEPIKPVLPVYNKAPEMEAEYTVKLNPIQADLPSIQKPVIFRNNYQKIEPKKPVLQELKSPQGPDITYEKPEIVRPMLPDTIKPSFGLPFRSFQMPEAKPLLLPEISLSYAVMINFQIPEMSAPDLPSTVRPEVNNLSYQEIERKQPDLPDISKVEFVKTPVFHKPEPIHIEAPDVVEIDRVSSYFNKQERMLPQLPKMSAVKAIEGDFSRPKPVQATPLPTVDKVEITIKRFKKPDRKQPKLPVTAAIKILDQEYVRPKAFQADLFRVVSPSAPVISFVGPERKMTALPAQSAPQIPDMDKKLTELMSVVREEYRIHCS